MGWGVNGNGVEVGGSVRVFPCSLNVGRAHHGANTWPLAGAKLLSRTGHLVGVSHPGVVCVCVGGYLLVHPSVNPLIGRIDTERELSNTGEEAEGQVVETPTADGAREIKKELFYHHNEDRVPKCARMRPLTTL